ncbi:hypothetical protein MAR_010703 [Mya arenaria]|uniref:Uncharacterized protein n=1 Tax=Mya arenaria TaxID=6604 RepID=A0ABY7FV09_MYAAR|nr:hypothetical protein MAR_010703 [Mya arenaria]
MMKSIVSKTSTTLREISGVSVGAAVGILVLGLFVGAMTTAALCVCCPSVHAKASAVRSGKKLTCCHGNLEDEEISNVNEQKSRHMPLAPFPSLPTDIRSTATTNHANTKSSLAQVTSP